MVNIKEINIGSKISQKRKDKGITQEELANFLGVTKAAISKWESGISYPDITLLPVIATFFNATVDEIIGYEPQMLKKDVTRLYEKLCNDFSNKPFEDVYAVCIDYLKKYYSCWNLQYHIGLLFVNHASLSGEMNKIMDTLRNAIEVFERVISESNDVSLSKKAVQLKAFCLIALNKPAETIDLLEDFLEAPMPTEVLLAQAYQQKGDMDKAETLLQGFIFQNLVGLFDAFPKLMMIYANDEQKTKECYEKAIELSNIFSLKKLHPSLMLTLYLTTAQIFVIQGKISESLDVLQKYAELCASGNFFPLKLKNDEFFTKIEAYIETTLCQTINSPRDEKVIKQSMKDAISQNPAFEKLKAEKRLQSIIEKLNYI